jgi:hypothetical protein
LVSGGALTLYVNVFLNFKIRASHIVLPNEVLEVTKVAWYFLLKVNLIMNSFQLASNNNSEQYSATVHLRNKIGWGIGITGLLCFFIGMSCLVYSAAAALYIK